MKQCIFPTFGISEALLLQVYCELTTDGRGWTLISRFSNNDVKNWMADTGHWWYDRQVSTGRTQRPFRNTDMISPAFWLVRGSEFKVTRIDDPSHTLCYRPQVTVWVDKHSDLKSQVMATLEMARSGPINCVWEVVRFNMAESTSQQTGFNRLIAVEASKVLTRSASDVTGILGMEQS